MSPVSFAWEGVGGNLVWPRPHDVESYIRQDKLRVVLYGLGPLGAEVARIVANRHDLEIVGAIDPRAGLAGHDLGEAAAVGRTLGIPVVYDPSHILNDLYADVVIHTGGESLSQVYSELLAILDAEKNVIATCPELVYPSYQLGEIGRRLDEKARDKGVRLLGVGVDPAAEVLEGGAPAGAAPHGAEGILDRVRMRDGDPHRAAARVGDEGA